MTDKPAGDSRILVTGATGNVGAEVVKALRQRGQPVVRAARNPAALRGGPAGGVEGVVFEFGRAETYRAAFEGVGRLFMMRPPQISDVRRYLLPVVDFAQEAGVQQIVFLSLLGAEGNRFVPHRKVEEHIRARGIPFTFLRPSFFMQNLNTTHQAEIRDRSEIQVPVGRGKTSFIDARDIGAVAAKVLSEPGHENRAYDLTGSEALDYYEVAVILSSVLGRTVTYRDPSVLKFLWGARAEGAPWQFALVMSGLYLSTRFGMGSRVTDDVPRLLGRAPITLRAYIEDYADAWRPAGGTAGRATA